MVPVRQNPIQRTVRSVHMCETVSGADESPHDGCPQTKLGGGLNVDSKASVN